MSTEQPKTAQVEPEGLIPKLEAILGQPLSQVSKELIESHMNHLLHAATQTAMQMMFEVSMLNMRITQALADRVLNPTGIVAGMQMPQAPATSTGEEVPHGPT